MRDEDIIFGTNARNCSLGNLSLRYVNLINYIVKELSGEKGVGE